MSCHLRLARIFAFALATCLAAQVARADVSVSVLGVEPMTGVPPELAVQLTDVLRQRLGNVAGLRLVPGKDLIEIKLIGCEDATPSCMAKAGKSLGVDKLIYGTIQAVGPKKSPLMSVKLITLDVRSASVERTITEKLPRKDLSANLTALGARWIGSLVDLPATPTLVVSSDPPDASIAIDGQTVGRTPATLMDLSPGVHTVTLSMNGRATATRTIELKRGGRHDLEVALEPEAHGGPTPIPKKKPPEPRPAIVEAPFPSPPPTRPASNPRPGRAAFITGAVLLGVAVGFGATAIYGFVHYRDLEKQTADDVAKCTPEPTQANPKPAPDMNCTMGADSPYRSHESEGKNWATITTAMNVTWVALAAGGITAIAVGAHQRKSAKRSDGLGVSRQAWSIQPTFGPQGAGVTANFSF